MRFHPEQHLRRQSDFRCVRDQGQRINCGLFTLFWLRRPDATTPLRRVGVVASIAAVGPAVQRNRAKRRLRELFRRHQDLVPAGSDLLLVARAAVVKQPFPVLEAKFTATCRQLSNQSHV
ncbi:MAG: ribonuclease P protein component [Cephaloticoccus sp.]|nr:ribonuclease P protein component [Cephaloticoccus sp.]MCF7760565.1 ribonuclease P protein component [Cephaloticoccus sp.]